MGPVMSGPFMASARPGGGGRGRVGQERKKWRRGKTLYVREGTFVDAQKRRICVISDKLLCSAPKSQWRAYRVGPNALGG